MEKVLVLDVDETLLNIEPLSFLKIFKENYQSYEGKLMFDKYYLSPRPNLTEFIEKAKKNFKLIAFSVVSREITIKKLKAIGILDSFFKIYGKEDLENGKKSIKKIANDLNIPQNSIVAVDDIPEHFLEHDKVIKIEPWFIGDSKKDSSLLNIFKNLEVESKVFS
ncbi:MAG: HAD family hydrolase [Nanoarchaeota archaeon]|nr:HAD family hydrolase [Nanoarchaeota archaeon]